MKHPFAELVGLRFESVDAGVSRCVLEVTEALHNPQRAAHGLVLYSLADTGMGAALYPTLAQGELCATIELKISYFKPVQTGTVECVTRLIHRGKRVAALESELFHDGALVAKANGSFAIFRPQSAEA